MRPFFYRYGANCCAKQVDTTKGYPKIDLFAFKGNDKVLHIGCSYGVGPKVNMRLFWIAYDCTLSDSASPGHASPGPAKYYIFIQSKKVRDM